MQNNATVTDSLDHDHVTASKVEGTLTDTVEDMDAAQPEVDAHSGVADTITAHTETALTRAGSAKHVPVVTNNRLNFRIC